ncbi:hypothetical protein DFH09DRAFT_1324041 [Mycena vulgaris]|nr:hypothetical protein DFH09DRAFT_1324041 [Mycena vulgaris]
MHIVFFRRDADPYVASARPARGPVCTRFLRAHPAEASRATAWRLHLHRHVLPPRAPVRHRPSPRRLPTAAAPGSARVHIRALSAPAPLRWAGVFDVALAPHRISPAPHPRSGRPAYPARCAYDLPRSSLGPRALASPTSFSRRVLLRSPPPRALPVRLSACPFLSFPAFFFAIFIFFGRFGASGEELRTSRPVVCLF